ncbi:MAG: YdcF family protein [Alphaproteobacteria bacterium]|nr:YdcF family protein [Alphaproteobacteria bacterium]
MIRFRLFIIAFLSGLGSWGLGFVLFFTLLPTQPKDTITNTDAIVVLTGSKGRVQYGFTLMQKGLAKKLFISGVNPKVKMPELIELQKIKPDQLNLPQTHLGYNAQNTVQNASETAMWAKQEDVKSIRLVTANYHIWRSMIEFSRGLPGVTIIPHPVDEPIQWPPKQFGLLLTEYNKFLWAWVGSLFI